MVKTNLKYYILVISTIKKCNEAGNSSFLADSKIPQFDSFIVTSRDNVKIVEL